MDAAAGRERCVERKGTLRRRDRRNGMWGNGREEPEKRGKMKGLEKTLRWIRRGEPHQTCIRETTKQNTSFHQTKLFLYFVLLAKCWHSQALLSRKPRTVLPLCVWQGGSWGLKFSWSRSEAVFDGVMLLFAAAYSQASWKHISWLSLTYFLLVQSSFPLQSISTFPCSITQKQTVRNRRKIKLALYSHGVGLSSKEQLMFRVGAL